MKDRSTIQDRLTPSMRCRAHKAESFIDECNGGPVGHTVLTIVNESGGLANPENMRNNLLDAVEDITRAFDSMDHRLGVGGTTDIQLACDALIGTIGKLRQS